MDVLSILRLVVRHWRVTAPAALLTLLVVGAVLKLSSPTYEATGAIVLMSPPEAPEVNDRPETAPPPEVGQNPFARYGDLSVVADILARVMDSDSTRAEFESLGVTGYNVVVNRFQRGPVVDVTGQGPTPEAATQSTETVLKEVDGVLERLQETENADPDYFITGAVLDPPSTATAMYGSTVRAAIAALAAGTLGTLGLAVIAEAVARRRAVPATAVAGPDTSDGASSGSEGGPSNGSGGAGWSAILPALGGARRKPARQEASQDERSKHEARMQRSARVQRSQHEVSKRAPVWLKARERAPSDQDSASDERSKKESAQPEPLEPDAARGKRSTQDVASGAPREQEPSTQESAWEETFQREPTDGRPADNGHRRATSDRSP